MANAPWVKRRGLQAKLGRYWVQGKVDQTAWRSPQTPPHVICLIETAAFSPVNNPHTEAVAAAREQIYHSMSRASAYAGGSIYLLFIWGFIQPRSWHKVSPASHKIRRWFLIAGGLPQKFWETTQNAKNMQTHSLHRSKMEKGNNSFMTEHPGLILAVTYFFLYLSNSSTTTQTHRYQWALVLMALENSLRYGPEFALYSPQSPKWGMQYLVYIKCLWQSPLPKHIEGV